MRKLAMIGILVVGLTFGWILNRAPAAAGLADSVSAFNSNLHAGDRVELYLDRSKSQSQVYLSGTLTALNGNAFELRTEVDLRAEGGGFLHQQVLNIVPCESVIYIAKVVAEETVPATKP